MPTMLFSEVTLEGWPAMRRSDLNRAKKAAWAAVGRFWLRKHLPKHFTQRGAAEYRYETLSRRYARRRARRGKRTPLVWTGALKRQVRSPARQRVSATSKGVRVTLRHDVRHRKVHDQLTRVSADDRKQLAGEYAKALAKELKAFRGRRRRRLRRAA